MHFTRRQALTAIASITASLVIGKSATAAVPAKKKPQIVVYVKDMHCASCAKRISTNLYKVKGVIKVGTNIKKNYAIVVPQKNKMPSAKAMWEATVAAKLTPVKLVTPQGTYTKAPKE